MPFPFDLMKILQSNPGVFFDVVAGDNGAYRAGPGRDQVTGFGVVDGQRLLTVIQGPPTAPPPAPAGLSWTAANAGDARLVQAFTTSPVGSRAAKAKAALQRGTWS